MYSDLIEIKRKFFKTGKTKDVSFRISMLKKLKSCILKYENDILYSLEKDLNRSKFVTYSAEIMPVLKEINYFIKNTKKLSKVKRKKTPFVFFSYKSYEMKEPYGVCLVVSPWNYPFLLTFSPLIGAISSGNCVIVKPSEYSVHTTKIIEKIIDEVFDKNYCEVVLGGGDVVENIIQNDVDFIFFTGSSKVGQSIMKKASENLTPIALELGGKSPCIVDKTSNIDKTAKRIVWGKMLNAGQTCIAPDYVLVDAKVKDKLVKKLIFYTEKFFSKSPLEMKNYPKIINEKHFARALKLIENQNVVYGGEYNRRELKISPTYVTDVCMSDKIMKEEIFAPILPIVTYNNIDAIYGIVEYNKNPLAMYIFSRDRRFINTIVKNIPCGNLCINDTILQVSNYNIPFGGRGKSGMGVYHGEYSYNLFSHTKGVFKSNNIIDISIRYKNDNNLKIIKKF